MSHQHIKDHYDKEVPSATGGSYESYRWFKSSLDEAAYQLTKEAIEKHLLADKSLAPEQVLEVGPGPGTWTKLLLSQWETAHYDLIDISKAMLTEAKKALGKHKEQIKFREADFATIKLTESYQLFFSSRAFEYFNDKEEFVAQVSRALLPGGTGFIITKYPHPWLNKLRRHKVGKRHKQQTGSLPLTQILSRFNFRVVGIYPVTVSVPFLKSPTANRLVGKLFRFLPLNPVTALITESYGVKFKKLETVELLGLPGAGKTTLAQKLEQEGFKLVKVRGRGQLLWLNLIFVSYFPRASFNFLKLLWLHRRGPKKLLYLKLMNLFFQANAKWILARDYPKAVIDQGHFQAFLSLFEHVAGKHEFKQLSAALPRASELVIVEAEPAVRLERLSARAALPRAEFGLTYAKHWQEISTRNYDLFKALGPELHLPKTIVINP